MVPATVVDPPPILRARYERQRRDWTLKQTAFFSNLTTAEISLIETGRLIPTAAQLAKLAHAFRVDASLLLRPVVVVDEESHA